MTDASIVPTISVCIPTYNGAAFLADTLASVAAQTFADFEVLIVGMARPTTRCPSPSGSPQRSRAPA